MVKWGFRFVAWVLVGMGMVEVLGRPVVERIVVSKSTHTLTLYAPGGQVLKTYSVVLGDEPGPKEREGDRKTPEGRYYVCFKNPKSRFCLSLGLSYPNEVDALRGLQRGLISREEYELIVKANRQKKIPPWKTALGGEIFIHGEKEGRRGTAGCIALSNREIEEIFRWVDLETPVIIKP